MRHLTNALYSIAQIRAIEAVARKSLKPDESLMELAGQKAFAVSGSVGHPSAVSLFFVVGVIMVEMALFWRASLRMQA